MVLVFYLEGKSDREFLKNFLPRKFPKIKDHSVDVKYITLEGKRSMSERVKNRIQKWQDPRPSYFIILRDQDAADCKKLKTEFQKTCNPKNQPNYLIRIVCRELENWYIGNLETIEKIYKIPNLGKRQNKNKYRNPDNLYGFSEISNLTKNKYQEVDGSRKIGAMLDLNNNCSHSFKIFCEGIEKILQTV